MTSTEMVDVLDGKQTTVMIGRYIFQSESISSEIIILPHPHTYIVEA